MSATLAEWLLLPFLCGCYCSRVVTITIFFYVAATVAELSLKSWKDLIKQLLGLLELLCIICHSIELILWAMYCFLTFTTQRILQIQILHRIFFKIQPTEQLMHILNKEKNALVWLLHFKFSCFPNYETDYVLFFSCSENNQNTHNQYLKNAVTSASLYVY